MWNTCEFTYDSHRKKSKNNRKRFFEIYSDLFCRYTFSRWVCLASSRTSCVTNRQFKQKNVNFAMSYANIAKIPRLIAPRRQCTYIIYISNCKHYALFSNDKAMSLKKNFTIFRTFTFHHCRYKYQRIPFKDFHIRTRFFHKFLRLFVCCSERYIKALRIFNYGTYVLFHNWNFHANIAYFMETLNFKKSDEI